MMRGICYTTSNIKKPSEDIRTLIRIIVNDSGERKPYENRFSEQGLSVHITDNKEEILIGAPGAYSWKGAVDRYHLGEDDSEIKWSKREATGVRNSKKKRCGHMLNPSNWTHANDSYFGYAVSSINLDGQLCYVASAPRASNQHGEVSAVIFKELFRETNY